MIDDDWLPGYWAHLLDRHDDHCANEARHRARVDGAVDEDQVTQQAAANLEDMSYPCRCRGVTTRRLSNTSQAYTIPRVPQLTGFTCPACRTVSHETASVQDGYCPVCCDWTGAGTNTVDTEEAM